MRPPAYAPGPPITFGGLRRDKDAYERALAVVLPIPYERTTSYVEGTRRAPREILLASTQLELWDEELGGEVADIGIHTLPEMELPFADAEEALASMTSAASVLFEHGKFPVVLGGEHSLTPAIVRAALSHHSQLTVLQIDAHADLRDSYMGGRFNHACAMRRVLELAPAVQVGIRSLSTQEAAEAERLPTRLFYDHDRRRNPDWIGVVVEALRSPVYVTIDCDGLDPAVMPAVGTPEPGGLGWYEVLDLLRMVCASRQVVGCDIVELCPIPGLAGPNFLCAKLIYKLLGYRFMMSPGR
jgi:agmatinase